MPPLMLEVNDVLPLETGGVELDEIEEVRGAYDEFLDEEVTPLILEASDVLPLEIGGNELVEIEEVRRADVFLDEETPPNGCDDVATEEFFEKTALLDGREL